MEPGRRASAPDIEQLQDSVLLDVRTPLAAATGYLRLLREGRVMPGEQTTHILDQAQASLRSIAVLCANADVCRRTDDAPRRMSVPATRVAESILGAVAAHDVAPGSVNVPPDASVEICGDWAELCHLLGHALGVVARPRKSDNAGEVGITAEGRVFRVSASYPPRPAGLPRSPFDPWAYPGLTVAAGLHALELAGGYWSFDDDNRTLRVDLEMIASPASDS